jgi:cyclic beta-1,2-glucan synthetase
MLGLHIHANTLIIAPCIPSHWKHFGITYRHGQSRYDIEVHNPNADSCGVSRVEIDGVLSGMPVELVDDGKRGLVRVLMGRSDG